MCIARRFRTIVQLAVRIMNFDDEFKGTNESWEFLPQERGLKIALSLQPLIELQYGGQ
jgi:hypothetical protein